MTRVRADALRCPRFRKAGEPFTDRNPSNLASMRAATRRSATGSPPQRSRRMVASGCVLPTENTGSNPERDLVVRLVAPPPAADRSRVKLGAFVWYGKWRRGPDSHTPLKHWSCPCPKASLGPSRPSFIDEVHAADAACALSQVRI